MGIEDDLANMLKFAKVGGGGKQMGGILNTLIRNTQVGVLKSLRREIDKQIKKLAAGDVSDALDPYEILGIKSNATKDEVKKAYNKRAFECHPDRGGSNMEMAKVNAAYQAICQVKGWSSK